MPWFDLECRAMLHRKPAEIAIYVLYLPGSVSSGDEFEVSM
jgi:hypothetical protein